MDKEDFIVEVDDEPRAKKRVGDPIELVRFDGTAITSSGAVVKHNWFKGLGLEKAKYADIMLTAEEAQRLHSAQSRMRLGASSSTPMKCYGGDICPISGKCGFVQLQKELDAAGEERNVVPIGRDCPVETDLLYEWVARYAEEFGVSDDHGNYTDQRIILELAECEVLIHRMNGVLATKFQDLSEEKLVAVMKDEFGEREQYIKEEADAFKIKERLEARKERLRKSLVATRFDQYKREAALKEGGDTDHSSLQSALAQRLRKLENLLTKGE